MNDLSEIPINPLLARLSDEDLMRRHKRAEKAVQEAKSKGKVSAELEHAFDEIEAEYNRRQRYRTLH